MKSKPPLIELNCFNAHTYLPITINETSLSITIGWARERPNIYDQSFVDAVKLEWSTDHVVVSDRKRREINNRGHQPSSTSPPLFSFSLFDPHKRDAASFSVHSIEKLIIMARLSWLGSIIRKSKPVSYQARHETRTGEAGVRCPTKRGGRYLINDPKPLFHHDLGGARCPTIPEGEGEADSSWLIRISTGAYFFPFMFRWTGGVHVKTKRNYTLEPNRLLLQSIFFSLTKYFHQEHRIKSSNFSTYSIVDLI